MINQVANSAHPFFSSALIGFSRPWCHESTFSGSADFAEKIGTLLVHPLHVAMGKTYYLDMDEKYCEKIIDPVTRIAMTIVFAASIPFVLLGMVFLRLSSSYQRELAHFMLRSTKIQELLSENRANDYAAIRTIYSHAIRSLAPEEIASYMNNPQNYPFNTTHTSMFAFLEALYENKEKTSSILAATSPHRLKAWIGCCSNALQMQDIIFSVADDKDRLHAIVQGIFAVIGDHRNSPMREAILRYGIELVAFGQGGNAPDGSCDRSNESFVLYEMENPHEAPLAEHHCRSLLQVRNPAIQLKAHKCLKAAQERQSQEALRQQRARDLQSLFRRPEEDFLDYEALADPTLAAALRASLAENQEDGPH